jgi:hypothetical protein
MSKGNIGLLWAQFARINFYIFSFLVLSSGGIALLSSGHVAEVAAYCCFVFAVLLTLGSLIRMLAKLNAALIKP